jgi:hypothetical protein
MKAGSEIFSQKYSKLYNRHYWHIGYKPIVRECLFLGNEYGLASLDQRLFGRQTFYQQRSNRDLLINWLRDCLACVRVVTNVESLLCQLNVRHPNDTLLVKCLSNK